MLRIVSYNIRAGLGTDGVRSIRRIAEVLSVLAPDVACLQEVDQHVPRSWLANQPKYLSTRLGMQSVFQKNLRLASGAFGNCVLVKPGARDCRCYPLPGTGEPRGLLEVIAPIEGQDVRIFCTHLGIDREERVEQARAVAEIVRSVHGPKVLCGDMNDKMGSETLAAILADPSLRDAAVEMNSANIPTCPPNARIDFILPDLRFDIQSYQVVESPASDHHPVIVDLEIA